MSDSGAKFTDYVVQLPRRCLQSGQGQFVDLTTGYHSKYHGQDNSDICLFSTDIASHSNNRCWGRR